MDTIFRDLPFAAVYIDDLIIASDNTREHQEHLKIIFETL